MLDQMFQHVGYSSVCHDYVPCLTRALSI